MQTHHFAPKTALFLSLWFNLVSIGPAAAGALLPVLVDPNFQSCLTETANINGWQYIEQVTQLNCPQKGIVRLDGIENLFALTELDLSNNKIQDVIPLYATRTLTRLNLSGNTGIQIAQLRPVLEQNWGLTHLRLNGITVGVFSNLGPLRNPQTWEPYKLVDLDLGNTQLSNGWTSGGNDLQGLLYDFPGLVNLNVASNAITNIFVLGLPDYDPNTGLTRPRFSKLAQLDLSNNLITDVTPLLSLRTLSRLNLSGNTGIQIAQLRPVLDQNVGLTHLGLNGIAVGTALSDPAALRDPGTGQAYNVVELDLGNTSLDPSWIQSLYFFPNLVNLNLAGNGIMYIGILGSTDYDPNTGLSRPRFSKLAQLDLSNNQIADVMPLQGLRTLTRLNLSGNRGIQMAQLRPVLDQNVSLTHLGLNGIAVGASLSDPAALRDPGTGQPYNLVELDLGNTSLDPSWIQSLYFFPNLVSLNLAGNGIMYIGILGFSDYDPNTGMSRPRFSKLAQLDLSNNLITEVMPLQGFNTLSRLNLSGNTGIQIAQLRPVLDQNVGLTHLGLNGIKVGIFSNLGTLRNPQTWEPYSLVELDLGNTQLSNGSTSGGNDLQGLLYDFPGLVSLNVAGNAITDIFVLGLPEYDPNTGMTRPRFSKLAQLDLSNNLIADVMPLLALRTLTRLNLSGNTGIQIAQLRPVLDQNVGLTHLGLNGIAVGTALSDPTALRDPGTGQPYNLVELDLGNTSLDPSWIQSLYFFPNLVSLNLAGNGIVYIGVLGFTDYDPNTGMNRPRFSKLAQLDLRNNQITDVMPLMTLRTLARLNLSGNTGIQIAQLRPVLDQNVGLTHLGLNGIAIGTALSDPAALRDPSTGQAYNLVELDLGNTGLDPWGIQLLYAFPNLVNLNLAGNGIMYIGILGFSDYDPNTGMSRPRFSKLAQLDLRNNQITDVMPLMTLRTLARLNLSGNTGIQIDQLRPVLDQNWGLTHMGLNGITVGIFTNLGLLRNPETWEPYKLVELDLGNTQLSNGWTSGGNDLQGLLYDFPGLVSLNVAGNAITNIFVLGFTEYDPNTGMTRPRFNKLAQLNVSNNQITEVFPLQTLRTLINLNLLDNNSIRCADLDMLMSVLNTTAVQRPASCIP